MKETKDRIILESNDDVFIFKTPRITKINKEKLLNEAASAKEKKDDLPSFEIDSTEPMLPKSEPQFIGTGLLPPASGPYLDIVAFITDKAMTREQMDAGKLVWRNSCEQPKRVRHSLKQISVLTRKGAVDVRTN